MWASSLQSCTCKYHVELAGSHLTRFGRTSPTLPLLVLVYSLRRYCYKNVPLIVRLAVSYAWLVSMSIVVLVPLDIYTTFENEHGFKIIEIIWKISYW